MLSIRVPTEASYVKQNIVLNNVSYDFVYTYNSRDQRMRLSIYQNSDLIIAGVKLMENQLLLGKYRLDRFEGDLACLRIKGDSSIPATKGTIGIEKEYELLYLTPEEADFE